MARLSARRHAFNLDVHLHPLYAVYDASDSVASTLRLRMTLPSGAAAAPQPNGDGDPLIEVPSRGFAHALAFANATRSQHGAPGVKFWTRRNVARVTFQTPKVRRAGAVRARGRMLYCIRRPIRRLAAHTTKPPSRSPPPTILPAAPPVRQGAPKRVDVVRAPAEYEWHIVRAGSVRTVCANG